jgi:AcrR family transcriptional regulator
MPYLLDTQSRAEDVAKACNHLLAERGIAGLTLRNIARITGVSPATLSDHFGSRDRLLTIAVHLTAKGREQQIASRIRRSGVAAFLPEEPNEVVQARSWLAWVELGRNEPGIEPVVDQARADDRAVLARSVDYALERAGLDAAMALVDGLLVALCTPNNPMPIRRARALLGAYLADSASLRSWATIASGSSAE